jgi:hypothetical protein
MDLTDIHDRFNERVGRTQITPMPNKKRRMFSVTKWVGTRPFTVTMEPNGHSVDTAINKLEGWLRRAYPHKVF